MSPVVFIATCGNGACGSGAIPGAPASEADVTVRLESRKVAEGEAVVVETRLATAPGWTIEPGSIAAEGLEAGLEESQGPVRSGDREVVILRSRLTGPAGSYVVDPGPATAKGPNGEEQTIDPPPLFVDIGVDGPTGGEMADFEPAPPPEPFPWALAAGAAAGAAGLAALAAFLWKRRREAPTPPPDPAYVVALRQWEEARRSGLDDHSLAVRLSMILRAYLEAIWGWPATARTTREILAWTEARSRLGLADRMRAARVLDATDRLKFAREGGGGPFFDALSEDFRAVVDATRPRGPEPARPRPDDHA